MADRIQQRRDTAARWAQYNPILLEGEVGYVTDDPNQYKIGDGVHAWNELPLRGFDGTLVHELGNSQTAAMSQQGVTEAIKLCNKIVPMVFPADALTQIETTYSDGLLVRQYGEIDLNQTSYLTSDFIEVSSVDNGVYIYYAPTNFKLSTYYASLCAYDENKKLLQAFPARNVGYLPFYFNENVKYVRVSIRKTEEETAGLYCSNEFDLYSSYKSERKKIENLIKEITDLNSTNYNTIFPFSFGKWEKFETTYEVGLLRTSGNIDASFENYRTSDFIELFTSDIMKKQVLAFSTDTVNVSGSFLVVAFYDENKTYISGVKGSNVYYIEVDTDMSWYAKYVVKVPIDAVYARITCVATNGEINKNVGLFHGALVSLDKVLTDLDKAVEDVKKEIPNNYWKGKNIWWCGTSIPAAGYWNVNNANSYPLMTGAILGAKRVFNEAVGSSCAAASNGGGTYEVVSRRMGDTIERKLAIFNDCWTVDDEAQTVVNGPRSMGITSIPSVTTYQSACTYRMQILSNCYEIKLIAKYLLKDQEEHDAFLQEKFGSLYNTLIALHPTAYTYQADIDLFVIDHSNNDGTAGSYSDINSQDMTTYVGALNTYVRLIQKYKPRATVVFISNYTDAPSGVIKTEGDIAANWHMPFCNLLERIPVGGRSFKITTRGYWDTSHNWHDDGFTWHDDGSEYTTNMDLSGMSGRVKGDLSLSQVKNNINPTLVDGKWYWDAYPNDIWMYDGLHPHSDRTLKCLRVYSQAIASFLKIVGDGVY